MKLQFIKDKGGNVLLTMNGEDFTTDNYLKIIKGMREGEILKLEKFDKSISEEEQESIKRMIDEINSIRVKDKFSDGENDTMQDNDEEDTERNNASF